MTDSLTLQEAAKLAGVPPEQLKRWAWTKNGPRNIGSKLKPRYVEEDILDWKACRKVYVEGGIFRPE